ncbi:MAG: translocation/assembly module TamB domain-containing protein [Bacteroidota bacterium]
MSYLSQYYSNLTGFDISMKHVDIAWFDKVQIKKLRVADPETNELAYIKWLTIDFDLQNILNASNHSIDEVSIEDANVLLTKIPGDSTNVLNINQLIRNIRSQIKRQNSGKGTSFTISKLSLSNSHFTYNDQERDSIVDGFDYHHFQIDSINGDFSNVLIVADTFELDVNSLTAQDRKTSLGVNEMQSSFRISQSAMEFLGLEAQIGNSLVKDTIIFKYNSTRDLSEFNTKINIEANLDKTEIHSKDLALFAPAFKKFNEVYTASGKFKGRINSFIIEDTSLKFGQRSFLRGRVRITGLPVLDDTFVNLNLDNSYVLTTDLRNYVSNNAYQRLSPFETINFNADFLGFLNDFVANGDFYTPFGTINSDINLKISERINESTYSGNLEMKDFNLGGYTGNEYFKTVTVNGKINGKGFTIEEADFNLNGRLDKIWINGYEYVNIDTDARFTKEFFEGFLSVDDPNLKLTTTGSIDLRAGIDFFNIRAELDTANFKALNLSEDELFISTKLDINARGLQLDSILGFANFTQTIIKAGDKTLEVDSLAVLSDKDEDQRTLLLNTNLFNFKITGKYDFTTVYKDLSNILYEYQLNLENDADALNTYYKNKEHLLPDYDLAYNVNVKDFNPVFELFAPDLYVSPASTFSGKITGGYTSIISFETYIDSLGYKNDYSIDTEIQLNISKITDSTDVLAVLYVESQNQNIQSIDTKNLIFEGIWNKRHIDYEFYLDQVKYANKAELIGVVDFLQDKTQIKFEESRLQLLDKTWKLSQDNLITLDRQKISFNNLEMYNNRESISLNGNISQDPNDVLTLEVDSVELDIINSIVDKDLSGTIQGFIDIKDYYSNLQVESEMVLNEFNIDDFLIGNVRGENHWNNRTKRFEINTLIERLDKKALLINGTYNPDNKENPLDLIAKIDNAELKMLEPFIDDYFSDISGTTSGELEITGTLSSPDIRGDGVINTASTHVNYLNTYYGLNGNYEFLKNSISFQGIDITDERGNKASMRGAVNHNGFKDMALDLKGNMTNFLVLNTSSEDNDLFYGTGVASGDIAFEGSISQLNISATAKSEKGTRIFIPIGDSENIEQEEFINFVSFSDSSNTKLDVVERIDLRGLKLDFDLDITPDAYCEIIFDIKSGDIIRGRGNGDLKLQIDTKGEFNMFGDYVIQEGGYNFTLYNIINKEFEILPNSKISWYGDPYQGILDIDATYNQLASLLPLVVQQEADEVLQESNELRRKYPVRVLLGIDGPLLSPFVDFDIIAEDLPRNIEVPPSETQPGRSVDLEFEFLKFKNSIDEQELKRQVFSLIVLRKFSPLQSFNTGGTISSSVSELLTNQLSYWITQVDENLEIDVDLGALDPEAFNTFQLRLSYTFLDGRLRVTRDGGFTNQSNKADISSIAGDWTLEYLLTDDGKFKVKMYNRTTFNPINQTEQGQNTITTGFSVIHTQSFNELKDLFKKSRKKGQERRKREEENSVNKKGTIRNEDEGE